MRITFGPLKQPFEKVDEALSALFGSTATKGKIQTWDCSRTPPMKGKPVTSVKALPFLAFYNAVGPGFGFPKQTRLNRALEGFFFQKVVAKKKKTFDADLIRQFGSYEMTIPFNKIIHPKYTDHSVTLYSMIDFAFFRVGWRGMKPTQWVILSLPIGHTHSIQGHGQCLEGGGFLETSLEDIETVEVDTVTYTPKTTQARAMRIASKKALAKGVQEKIDKLEEEMKKHLEDAKALEEEE